MGQPAPRALPLHLVEAELGGRGSAPTQDHASARGMPLAEHQPQGLSNRKAPLKATSSGIRPTSFIGGFLKSGRARNRAAKRARFDRSAPCAASAIKAIPSPRTQHDERAQECRVGSDWSRPGDHVRLRACERIARVDRRHRKHDVRRRWRQRSRSRRRSRHRWRWNGYRWFDGRSRRRHRGWLDGRSRRPRRGCHGWWRCRCDIGCRGQRRWDRRGSRSGAGRVFRVRRRVRGRCGKLRRQSRSGWGGRHDGAPVRRSRSLSRVCEGTDGVV
jgi:hypothetical protein